MISKMLKCLIVPGILLVMTSNALGADNNWNPAGVDNLWSNPANWENGLLAKGGGDPRIETGIGDGRFCVLNSPAIADRMRVGDDSVTGLLYIQDGADLTIGRCDVGVNNGSYGEIHMGGGSVNGDDIWKIGKKGSGLLVMSGGLLRIGNLKMSSDVASTPGANTGHLQLDGGTVYLCNLLLAIGAEAIENKGTGTIDITAGKLIIDGNDLYDDLDDFGVYTHIAGGRITAYDGQGTLFVDYTSYSGPIVKNT